MKNVRLQNCLLLAVSYGLYGWANWKMLPVLIGATVVFYFLGIAVSRLRVSRPAALVGAEHVSSPGGTEWLTGLGVALGIGMLAAFKYIGVWMGWSSMIVPLGISFFTFRLISYIIEIKRGKYEATRDFVVFANYISFFPCLLAGPIDRPAFMEQLKQARRFAYSSAVDGCRQILWGAFKKVVIANNCATYVDWVWGSYGTQSGSTLVLAAVLYTIQIYTDFSGYSDIAIGAGKLLGFKVADNFRTPLFAVNIKDYWQRWHMSLTSWLTDYVFMPLNLRFRDMGTAGTVLAIVINFVLCGLWHGGNWTFVLWGLYNGLLFIPLIWTGGFYKKPKMLLRRTGLPVARDFGRMIGTFVLVVIGMVLFRAPSVGDAGMFMAGVFDRSLWSVPEVFQVSFILKLGVAIGVMAVVDWLGREYDCSLKVLKGKKWNWIAYYALLAYMAFFTGPEQEFIYFQF